MKENTSSSTQIINFSNETSSRRPTAGNEEESLCLLIAITTAYSTIFVLGVLGNIFTLHVIKSNKSLHSATNYYLSSLALSDMLLLVAGLPQELYMIWYKYQYIFGYTFCKLRGFISELTTNASVLTITAFTVERYVAICHPLKSKKWSSLRRVVCVVSGIWVVSGLEAAPFAYYMELRSYDWYGEHRIQCKFNATAFPMFRIAFQLSAYVMFLLPMFLITAFYAQIGKTLKSQLRSLHTNEGVVKSRKKVIHMLVAVASSFFLCFAPFHAQRLYALYADGRLEWTHQVYYYLTILSGITYYLSSCVNPILYHFMSAKFKAAFLETTQSCLVCGNTLTCTPVFTRETSTRSIKSTYTTAKTSNESAV